MEIVHYPDFEKLISSVELDGRIIALFLIGSYGTPYYNALSDLDFAVLTNTVLDISEQLHLSNTFSHILGTDRVDIVFLTQASLQLQYSVLDKGRLLHVKNRILLADFVEQTIKRYCDFAPFLSRFYRDYDTGLREEFL